MCVCIAKLLQDQQTESLHIYRNDRWYSMECIEIFWLPFIKGQGHNAL